MLKLCKKCENEKELSEFTKNKRNKDGLEYACRECRNIYFRKHSKTKEFKASQNKYKSSKKGKDALSEYRKIYTKTEKHKKYEKSFRETPKQKERIKRSNEKFFKSEKGKAYLKEYRKTEKSKARSNYNTAMRRARKKQATPKWLTNEDKQKMKEIYLECQRISSETNILHHVDHIIPLKGKNVSGLHVPWNLQILEGKANCKKSNK